MRGLLLGALIGSGRSPLVAALITMVVFGLGHAYLGAAGVLVLVTWAAFPTLLRLRFDNLAGPMLLHGLHNAYVYLVIFSEFDVPAAPLG